jgi:hypothetical protein
MESRPAPAAQQVQSLQEVRQALALQGVEQVQLPRVAESLLVVRPESVVSVLAVEPSAIRLSVQVPSTIVVAPTARPSAARVASPEHAVGAQVAQRAAAPRVWPPWVVPPEWATGNQRFALPAHRLVAAGPRLVSAPPVPQASLSLPQVFPRRACPPKLPGIPWERTWACPPKLPGIPWERRWGV